MTERELLYDSGTTRYRITVGDPPPIPSRFGCDVSFVADDFDGAPDGNDNRYGSAATIEDALDKIDEIEEDNEL